MTQQTFACLKAGLSAFFGLIVSVTIAQKKIDQQYHFKDGVFKAFQDFRQDKAKPLPADLRFDVYRTDEGNIAYLTASRNGAAVSLTDSLWGVSIDGAPYIRMKKHGGQSVFVKLHVVGRLCYFYYEDTEMRDVVMNIYHPQSGAVIAKRTIQNQVHVLRQKLMNTETGELADFNTEAFSAWTKQDERVSLTLKDLKPEESGEKLFKLLLIYNDRNIITLE